MVTQVLLESADACYYGSVAVETENIAFPQ